MSRDWHCECHLPGQARVPGESLLAWDGQKLCLTLGLGGQAVRRRGGGRGVSRNRADIESDIYPNRYQQQSLEEAFEVFRLEMI